jgi:NAD(P)-dependent dehydrogenase (short-subunit alcohol dehydrogenase family)
VRHGGDHEKSDIEYRIAKMTSGFGSLALSTAVHLAFMQPPLSNEDARVAVVTGASRGIGAAVARRLAADGARLVLVARDRQRLRDLADELPEADPVVAPADLSSTEDMDALIALIRVECGRVDVLVNNAGILPRARRVESVPDDDWSATLAINLTAPWYLSTRLLDLMDSGSVVVNVASSAAFYPSVGLAPYNVAKAGLVMLTRCCALEWAARGVRVVGVAPGKVSTDMVGPILDYLDAHGTAVNPLGRVAEPGEIASLVSFLASDDAAYVTGSVIAIDGGELCGGAAVAPAAERRRQP